MFNKKFFKTIGIILGLMLIAIQFFKPEQNVSGNATQSIATAYPVPERVKVILDNACMDCHSNTTKYPWYSNVQPVAWWLADHVKDGKKHLNFDEFMSYRPYRQYHKLEEIDEVIQEGEMPMTSYTLAHSEAKLDANQKEILINWSKALRDSMSLHYPKDSLEKPKK